MTVANCIFETDDPDFSIYKTRERGGWSFFCGITVPDISKIDTSTYGGRVDTITDDDPKLRDEVLVGENGAFALGVDVNSPVRKKGFALYSSDSDPVVYYIHVPHKSGNADKTWHNLPGNGSYSDAEALQKGISTASPLVPDAFGAPRTDGKIAYGPLNAPNAGLMLLLR